MARFAAQAPLLIVVLALLFPTRMSVFLLVHVHDDFQVHAHIGGAAWGGWGHSQDHSHDRGHGAGDDIEAAMVSAVVGGDRASVGRSQIDNGPPDVPAGIALLLNRRDDPAPPSPTATWLAHVPPVVGWPRSGRAVRLPARTAGSERLARPPPRHGLDLILVTSHALLL